MAEVRYAIGVLLPEELRYYGSATEVAHRYEPMVISAAQSVFNREQSLVADGVRRIGAELDDLLQVGREYVWYRLRNNTHPSSLSIRQYMNNYCRWIEAQESYDVLGDEPVPGTENELTHFDLAAFQQWDHAE